MDLRHIRYFVAIAEAGSITAAARTLRVAQPALSQHVITLEKELGRRLLERIARGVRLTPSGETFIEHARIVLGDVERAREAVADTGRDVVGEVVLGLPTTVAPVLAVPLMEAGLLELPRVSLHLVESHSGFLLEWLAAARLDLAVVFNVAGSDGLDLTPLVNEELQLVSPGKARLARKSVSLSELRDLDLFMAGKTHDLRKTLDDAVSLARRRPLRIKAEIDSLQTIKGLVIRGLGHTILPLAAVQEEVADGRLNARRITRPTIERHAVLAALSRRPRTRAQHAVASLVRSTTMRLLSEGKWSGKPLSAV